MESLVVGGGCFMNCLANGKIIKLTPFKNVGVSFAAEDSGNAIGAALVVARKMNIHVNCVGLSSNLGPTYSDALIGEILEKMQLRYEQPDNIFEDTVNLLKQNKVVAWFQGASEYGPRALGNRSILASPIDVQMKDTINRKIKYRESYRPFAPVINLDRKYLCFEDGEDSLSISSPVPYMEKALPFKPDIGERIPAVVHADGTGRLQTVTEEGNPKLYQLLKTWEQSTGIPVLLNTSFNLNGEPIVCSPEDAIRTFVTSGLDALVIGGYLLQKQSL